MWLPKWAIRRRERDEAAILARLHPTVGWPGHRLSEVTGIRLPRLYSTLDRLERDGQILSRWADTPTPRLRLYYLTPRRDIDDGWNGGLRG